MACGTVHYDRDLSPGSVERVMAHLAYCFSRPRDALSMFLGLDHAVAAALLLLGPDACRERIAQAVGLLPELVRIVGPEPSDPHIAEACSAASFTRIAECCGLGPPAPPIADWLRRVLDRLAAASLDFPMFRPAAILHAIGEGRFALARELIDDVRPHESEIYPSFPRQRGFLRELTACAAAGTESPELRRAWESLLAGYADLSTPLSSFDPSELFLIARIVNVTVRRKAPGSVARDLHAHARSWPVEE